MCTSTRQAEQSVRFIASGRVLEVTGCDSCLIRKSQDTSSLDKCNLGALASESRFRYLN